MRTCAARDPTYLSVQRHPTNGRRGVYDTVRTARSKGRAPRRVRERAVATVSRFYCTIPTYTHFALRSRLCILQRHLTPVRQQAPLRVQCDSAVPTVSYLYLLYDTYVHSLRAPLRCLCNNQEKLHLAMNMVYFIIYVPGQLAINSDPPQVDVGAM